MTEIQEGSKVARVPYWHVRKEDVHWGSSLDRNPSFASFDVVLRLDYDHLSERLTEKCEWLDRIRVAAWTLVHANQPMLLGTVEDNLYRVLCEFDASLSSEDATRPTGDKE